MHDEPVMDVAHLGHLDGVFGWHVMSAPVAVGDAGLALHSISVTVSWISNGRTRQVTLVTQRLNDGGELP